MRGIGSSLADPFSALAGAAAALYGPLHGGANEAVLLMLEEIGSVKNVPAFIASVKRGEGRRLMGFGHRVYKSYDPRARIVKQTADAVFEVTGRNPLLDIALELERIALEDDYFVSRRLYPNVDFYSGLIYQAMGFPVAMFPVLFAIPRTVGWLAQWDELLRDSDQKIARPAADLHRPEPPGLRAASRTRREQACPRGARRRGGALGGPGLAVVGDQRAAGGGRSGAGLVGAGLRQRARAGSIFDSSSRSDRARRDRCRFDRRARTSHGNSAL